MLWVTLFLSKILSCPFIHSRHNSLYEDQAKWYQRLLARLDAICIRRATAVICHGPFLCQQMQELGVQAHKVIDFDVAFHSFSTDPNLTDNGSFSGRSILYIGRVEKSKGVFDLLDASEPLLHEYPDMHIRYIGDGPALENLKKKIVDKNLSNQVICQGRVEHAKLINYLCTAYLVVTPTRQEFPEGRCMAAMEALACSVPVVAPASGPFPYLVTHGANGVLYEPDNIHSLSSSLSRILSDDEFYKCLKSGANETAIELQTPVRTFYQAVELAFNV